MKVLLKIMTAALVLFLAQWATAQMNETRAALKQRNDLRAMLEDAREDRRILRAEWVYLNRPDRLRALVELNADALGLMPLGPEHFGEIDQIAFPERPTLDDVQSPVDAAARLPGEQP